LGKRFKARSPNARFNDGAKEINGKVLSRVEAIGKNLFYFFGEGENLVVVHIHFGMAGRLRISSLPGPPATATTRLELVHEQDSIIAQLSAMTVQHGGIELYEKKNKGLGPDPLREDADPEQLWRSLLGCKKSVGEVLMAQEKVCCSEYVAGADAGAGRDGGDDYGDGGDGGGDGGSGISWSWF
jgi:formamidopyrimidine-DNA glycosylase